MLLSYALCKRGRKKIIFSTEPLFFLTNRSKRRSAVDFTTAEFWGKFFVISSYVTSCGSENSDMTSDVERRDPIYRHERLHGLPALFI